MIVKIEPKFKGTKKDRIRSYLMTGNSLTSLTAMANFGTMRLAAVIHDLKKEGDDIRCELKTAPNGSRYGEYTMVKDRVASQWDFGF